MVDQVDRLARIEGKLDKMSEAIVSLARMEERMIALFKRMDSYDTSQQIVMTRISKLEMLVSSSEGSNKWVDRVIVVVLTGAISFALFASK